MRYRFLFHSPKGERGIGKLIVGWTWFLGLFYNWKVLKYNFSHEEGWKPDKNGQFERRVLCKYHQGNMRDDEDAYHRTEYLGTCFSSTTRGDANGVRFEDASKVVGKHPERWWYVEVEIEDDEKAISFVKSQVGKEYDFAGIAGFVQPVNIQDHGKWYCSEIMDTFKWLALVRNKVTGGRYKLQKRVSPRRAAHILVKMGYTIKRLTNDSE